MLAINQVVQILYLTFWSIEVVQMIVISYVLLQYYAEIEPIVTEEEKKQSRCKCVDGYLALTVMFVILSVMKLVGFMGVYTFKVTIESQETAHYVMASLGFACSVLVTVTLFIRRTIFWNHAIENRLLDHILLFFNWLYVAGILASCIVFGITLLGIPEMILAFLLQGETLFLIYDIWKDPASFKKPVAETVRITAYLRHKRGFVDKMYHAFRLKKYSV
jgi:hypothetical protein